MRMRNRLASGERAAALEERQLLDANFRIELFQHDDFGSRMYASDNNVSQAIVYDSWLDGAVIEHANPFKGSLYVKDWDNRASSVKIANRSQTEPLEVRFYSRNLGFDGGNAVAIITIPANQIVYSKDIGPAWDNKISSWVAIGGKNNVFRSIDLKRDFFHGATPSNSAIANRTVLDGRNDTDSQINENSPNKVTTNLGAFPG